MFSELKRTQVETRLRTIVLLDKLGKNTSNVQCTLEFLGYRWNTMYHLTNMRYHEYEIPVEYLSFVDSGAGISFLPGTFGFGSKCSCGSPG